MKPAASARGIGIKLVNKLDQGKNNPKTFISNYLFSAEETITYNTKIYKKSATIEWPKMGLTYLRFCDVIQSVGSLYSRSVTSYSA